MNEQFTFFPFNMEKQLPKHYAYMLHYWSVFDKRMLKNTQLQQKLVDDKERISYRVNVRYFFPSVSVSNTSFFGKALFDFETLHLRMVCTTCSFPQTHAKHFPDCAMTRQSKSLLPTGVYIGKGWICWDVHLVVTVLCKLFSNFQQKSPPNVLKA